MKHHFAGLLIAACLFCLPAAARERQLMDSGWRFALTDHKTDRTSLAAADYDDSGWRQLDLPHDWAIEGDFLESNPSGAGGGALPGGVGWYRRRFTVDRLGDDRFYIDFDGVYMNSTVYVNGHELGTRPYGYISFRYDMTPHLRQGENVVAVRVDNSDQPNSRWYSGCGIYRHVWMERVAPVHIDHWGVFVRTDGNGVKIDTRIVNPRGKAVTVRHTLIDAQGRTVGIATRKGDGEAVIKARKLRPWSPRDPYIYNVRTELLVDGQTVDAVVTATGLRTCAFDPAKGFSLNGKPMKINGVCLHHDLGCLGAALHEEALHRQLRKMKEMGCNAIRCSHNPPSPELLAMCDTMGLMVMDESFDMWRRKKTQNDYARFFDQWARRDLTDMVLRDRNHPSVIMWSIGNEVLEQWSDASADTLTLEQANMILNAGHDASTLARDGEMSVNSLLARNLADIVRQLDTTRPVTSGCNEPAAGNHLFRSGAMDIIGYNYHHEWLADVPKNFPGTPFIFTETVSALQTRGFYSMPSDSVIKAPDQWWLPYSHPSMQCSAYDNMHAPWSSTHEAMMEAIERNDFAMGQFVWTGWDYIGEPTPYSFPARSSYFGIVDLAGFPKDVYYLYQSQWSDTPVLHIFPHWNWIEGEEVDLWCYYNQADEVELYINGESQGARRKGDGQLLSTAYHVGWRTRFTPGEVCVVARKDGKVTCSRSIHTAGAPAGIRLTSEPQANLGHDSRLTFVNVEVVDGDGNLCPWADDDIHFSVEGAEIAGVDNGCQYSMERFKDDHRKAFYGKCLVVLRSKPGACVRLTAKSPMLKSATMTVNP